MNETDPLTRAVLDYAVAAEISVAEAWAEFNHIADSVQHAVLHGIPA